MYHTLLQIFTPVPIKTDLQFAVKLRCFIFLLYVIFLFPTNDDTGAITSWHRQENAIKIPESPNPRNFILFIIKPYQRLIKRDSETMDRKYGNMKRISVEHLAKKFPLKFCFPCV